MKSEWAVLLISAGTDFIINVGTAVGTAMVATGTAVMPSMPVLILASIGGLVAAARTIQQALKAAPDSAAKLKGA